MSTKQQTFSSLVIIFAILVAISIIFSSVNLVVADVNNVSNHDDFNGKMIYLNSMRISIVMEIFMLFLLLIDMWLILLKLTNLLCSSVDYHNPNDGVLRYQN